MCASVRSGFNGELCHVLLTAVTAQQTITLSESADDGTTGLLMRQNDHR